MKSQHYHLKFIEGKIVGEDRVLGEDCFIIEASEKTIFYVGKSFLNQNLKNQGSKVTVEGVILESEEGKKYVLPVKKAG